ncbi:MAG: prepilin peptidase [Planctomycetota bacterium]|nr:prepilin peptidase [Planctomycetota bacterium]
MEGAAFATSAAVFGACIGSFLNVVIWRLQQEDPRKRSVLGRSYCPACGAQIRWFDNLPVLGWIALRGKARCCGAKISARYPLVESLTAALFFALAHWPPFGPVFSPDGAPDVAALIALGLHSVFVSMLIALTFIDFDTQLLPDVLTKPGMAIGLAAGLWPGVAGTFSADPAVSAALRSLLASVAGLVVGGGVTWGVRALGSAVFRKEAMGFGDVKLMAMIGAFLGWQAALLTLFLGCVFGAFVGVALTLRGGLLARIPFGPYLAMGAVAALFWGEQLVELLFVRWPEWQRQNPTSIYLVLTVGVGALLAMLLLLRRARR